MDEEKIFGPFTFRQFIYVAGGIGIIYFVYNNFAQNMSIPFAIVIAAATFVFVRKAEPAPFNEESLRIKKTTLSKEEFEKWCRRKIAMIQSQIYVREQKGLVADPILKQTIESLEKATKDQV